MSLSESLDYAKESVPQSQRRGPITMGLLWVTMVTFFPGVLIGFDWCKQGISFWQVILFTSISCLVILAYTVPAAHLAALTGKGYSQLNRAIFGNKGASFIDLNLLWVFTAWYGLAGFLLAEGLSSLFHWAIPIPVLSGIFAILMAFNNFFGFSGVANFARFLAAPVLIIWVLSAFYKASHMIGIGELNIVNAGGQSSLYALTTISSFVIGVAMWGNESDYWRFGKARKLYAAVPLCVSLILGQIIFPCTGWILGHITGIGDFAAATEFMNKFSFGSYIFIGALVIFASYVAANDSNLFGSTSAAENLFNITHKIAVSGLAISGAITAVLLSAFGAAKALESVASLNAVILPTPTIIVLTEWYLSKKIFGKKDIQIFMCGSDGNDKNETTRPAITAFVIGSLVGICCSGLIPQLKFMHQGICPINAWFAAFVVYVSIRLWQRTVQLKDIQFLKLKSVIEKEVELISD